MYFQFVFSTLFYASLCYCATENSNINETIHRLSEDVIPTSYVLKIAPNLPNSTYTGSVNISVRILAPTNTIQLHSKQLNITNCKVTEGKQTSVNQLRFDPKNDLLVIELSREIKAKRTLNLSIDFHGALINGTTGFIKGSYEVNKTKKLLAFTHFEPTHARSAFPCFDEPKYKATFKIYIERDLHLNAISNMPLKQTVNSSVANRVWDEFETSPPMPTYLVAFLISEFQHLDASNRSVAVWIRESAKHQTNYALKQGVRCLQQLEKMVGLSYMLPKLDFAAIPTPFAADGMENWGLMNFAEFYLTTLEKDTDVNKRYTTEIECHEIAHQWFGNLVTPAWWDYLWLKEGFATYYQYFAMKEIEPSFRAEEWFVVKPIHLALWLDNRVDRAMTKKIETKSQLSDIYDTITYYKGAAVLRMLEHIISPQVFHNFTNNFLKTGRDDLSGIMTQDDFLDVLEEEVSSKEVHLPPNTTISQIMKTWTENTGFPLITVIRDLSSQTVTFTQTTYKTPRAKKPQPNQQWIVPLTYTTSGSAQFYNTTPTLWSFAGEQVQIQIPNSKWILCNLQQSGYYRVNYDTYNWELLIAQLLIDHTKIPAISRAQLLNDAFAMAHDEIISYAIPIQMSLYLPKERDPIVWQPVINHQFYILLRLLKSKTNLIFKQYVQLVIKTLYENIGFQPKPEDDVSTRLLRPKLLQLACAAGLSACVRSALDEYENHNDIGEIHRDLKLTVFQTALRHAKDSHKTQNKLLALYEKSDNVVDKETILMAAEYARSKTFLKKLLSKTTTQEIMERIKKPNNFNPLISSDVSLAYLYHMHDGIVEASDLQEDDVLLLDDILSKIDTGILTDGVLNLLQKIRNTLVKFELKYNHVIESIDHLYTSSTKISQQIQNQADKFETILINIMTTFSNGIISKWK